MVEHPTGARFLDWREMALLQGFPSDAVLATGGLTRAVKMIAQAIPIQVGRAILKAIVAEGMPVG